MALDPKKRAALVAATKAKLVFWDAVRVAEKEFKMELDGESMGVSAFASMFDSPDGVNDSVTDIDLLESWGINDPTLLHEA